MKKIKTLVLLTFALVLSLFVLACAKATEIAKPEASKTEFVYTGSEIDLGLALNDAYTISGVTKATNVGSYEAKVTLNDTKAYNWVGGTTEELTITWSIINSTIAKPTATIEFTYDGNEHVAVKAAAGYSVTGEKATNAGTYTAKVSLNDKTNTKWADGTTEDLTISWEISKKQIALPTFPETLEYTYTGEEITFASEAEGYTLTNNKGTVPQTYRALAVLADKENTEWADGTSDDITKVWTINKADIDLTNAKFENSTITYDGKEHSLQVTGLDSKFTVSYSKENLKAAGTYEITATISAENYNDNSMTATLVINKADNAWAKEYSAFEFTYTGEALDLGIKSTVGTPVLTIKLGEKTVTEIKDAGEYTVSAKVTVDNYNDLTLAETKVVVKKADYDFTNVKFTSEFTYDGAEHTVTVEGLPEGLTATCADTLTIVGEKATKVTFTNTNENYNSPAEKDFTLKVNKVVVEISTFAELKEQLNKAVNFTAVGAFYTYKLTADIDCSSETWKPVGSFAYPFFAEIDGNSKVIKNLKVDDSTVETATVGGNHRYYAFITNITDSTIIHDITFKDAKIIAKPEEDCGYGYFAGVLFGRYYENNVSYATSQLYNITLDGCEVTMDYGAHSCTIHVGALGGFDRYTFDASQGGKRDNLVVTNTKINITATNKKKIQVGGLFGDANYQDADKAPKYTNCKFDGEINIYKNATGFADCWVGAYVGHAGKEGNSVTLENCTNSMNINVYSADATAFTDNTGEFSHWIGTTQDVSVVNTNSTWTGKFNRYTIVSVPTVGDDLTYNGIEQTANIPTSDCYTITNNKATKAGLYVATLTLNSGYVWDKEFDGNLNWTIKKADYNMTGIVVTNSFVYDGNEHKIKVTNLPEGVEYATGAKLTAAGSIYAVVSFTSEDENYNEIKNLETTLTVTKKVIEVGTLAELNLAMRAIESLSDKALQEAYVAEESVVIKLTADIDGEGATWAPVGIDTDYKKFNGEFDGNGHVIKNFIITDGAFTNNSYYYAFFGCISNKASIHDVTFDNIQVKAEFNADNGGNGLYVAVVFGRVYPLVGQLNTADVNVQIYNVTVKNSYVKLINHKNVTAHVAMVGAYDTVDCDTTNTCKRDNIQVLDNEMVIIGDTNKKIQVGTVMADVNYEASGKFNAVFSKLKVSGNRIVVSKLQADFNDCWVGGYFGNTKGISVKLVDSTCDTKVELYTLNTAKTTTCDASVVAPYTNWFGINKGSTYSQENSTFPGTSTVTLQSNLTADVVVHGETIVTK